MTTAVSLFATHSPNVDGPLVNELTAFGAQIDECECSPTKTSFSIDVTESWADLLQLRNLRYADEVYLKIYHNRMHPSKDHPDCPVEMRAYFSLLFYSINYVPEILRCIEIIRSIDKHRLSLPGEDLVVHFVLLTSERSPVWKRGLQIVQQELPRHVKYALRKEGHSWTIQCHDTLFKAENSITVVVYADRHDIYAGVLLFDEEAFRPHLTFWQLDGSVAATVVELVGVHDGDIVLDMACDCGELTLEVLRNYDCFCIAMSPQIDQLAMAEVNWVGLQNQLKKEAGSRARHLQFIAVEFNKDFFNFNVVNKILCSLPLRWWKKDDETLDLYYDKLFIIISKCRQETYTALLIPLMKKHKRRVKEGSLSNKYNFQVLNMRRLVTRSTQMYVCLLETKLPRLKFPERSHAVDLLVPHNIPQSFDFTVSETTLLQRSHTLSLPPVHDHLIHSSLSISMLHQTISLDLSIQHPATPIDITTPCTSMDLPPLSGDQIITSDVYDFLLNDPNLGQ